MNHYCVKCKHLYNIILEKCPKCGNPRDYHMRWAEDIAEVVWTIRKNAYHEGYEDGMEVGHDKN